ncbi:hypothetical protein L1887_47618 [Cichorium endivia]|nr:hypothetical protein L1887_47618 [Cichorium endivia]
MVNVGAVSWSQRGRGRGGRNAKEGPESHFLEMCESSTTRKPGSHDVLNAPGALSAVTATGMMLRSHIEDKKEHGDLIDTDASQGLTEPNWPQGTVVRRTTTLRDGQCRATPKSCRSQLCIATNQGTHSSCCCSHSVPGSWFLTFERRMVRADAKRRSEGLPGLARRAACVAQSMAFAVVDFDWSESAWHSRHST